MRPEFDPYRQWLGIRDERRPPHHYRLLGRPLFDDDPAAVALAAAQQTSRLSSYLRTAHAYEAQRILQEIETARVCLTDPQKKRAYDAALQTELTGRPADHPRTSLRKSHDVDHLLPPQAGTAPLVPDPHDTPPAVAFSPPSTPMPPPPPPAMPSATGAYAPAKPPSAFSPSASPGPVATAIPVAPVPLPTPPAFALPQAVPVAIPVAAPVPIVPPTTPVAAILPPPEPLALPAMATKLRNGKATRPQSQLLLYAGAPALAIVVIGLIVVAMRNRPAEVNSDQASDGGRVAVLPVNESSEPESSVRPVAAANAENDPPPRVASKPRPLEISAPPTTTIEPIPPSTPPPPKPAVSSEDAAKRLATARQALSAARVAMSRRDVKTAREQLKKADEADVDDKLEDEAARLDLMAKALDTFWKGVRESVKGLVVAEQVTIRDTVVGVVENSPDKLVLRFNGKNETYSQSTLPPLLALGLAERWLAKQTPETMLALGAFQAMDSRADRSKAKTLFEEAAALGKPDEAAMLIAELNVSVPTTGEDVVVKNVVKPDAVKPGADGRYPVPAIAVQTKARDEAHKSLGADYNAAKDAEAKLVFAEKLSALAGDASIGTAAQYVFMIESQQLAAQAGDFDLAMASIDKLAESYAVDALDAKADLLFEAAKASDAPAYNQALANAALPLSDEAVLLEQPAVALRIIRIALGAARKSRDADLLKQASAREKEIKELKKP